MYARNILSTRPVPNKAGKPSILFELPEDRLFISRTLTKPSSSAVSVVVFTSIIASLVEIECKNKSGRENVTQKSCRCTSCHSFQAKQSSDAAADDCLAHSSGSGLNRDTAVDAFCFIRSMSAFSFYSDSTRRINPASGPSSWWWYGEEASGRSFPWQP